MMLMHFSMMVVAADAEIIIGDVYAGIVQAMEILHWQMWQCF
jgi:hypothetical protein